MESLNLSGTDRLWIACMRFCKKYFKCHQMSERSFFIRGYQFPICARCTGILAGHITGMLTAAFRDLPFTVLLGVIPLIVDGGMQQVTDYESTNRRRFITGCVYGFSTMTAIFHAVRLIVKALKRAAG